MNGHIFNRPMEGVDDGIRHSTEIFVISLHLLGLLDQISISLKKYHNGKK
jgi:hypothetical protein